MARDYSAIANGEAPMTRAQAKEVLDRMRRVETRLTAFMEEQHFDTQTKKPEWLVDGRVRVPSRRVAWDDILATIPDTHQNLCIPVVIGRECTLLGYAVKPLT